VWQIARMPDCQAHGLTLPPPSSIPLSIDILLALAVVRLPNEYRIA
jgi:hypothetical protein